MFLTEEGKDEAKRRWREVEDGNYRLESELEDEMKSITLMGIPMEYPALFLEEYMLHDGTNLSKGLRRIIYKELKRPLGKTVYVEPDMPAYLVGPVTLPITEMTLFCDRCLQKGHLIYGCPNDVKCRRCKENGHTADKCVYLQESRVSRWKQRAENPTDQTDTNKMTTNPVQDAVDAFMTVVVRDDLKKRQRAKTEHTDDNPTQDLPDNTQDNNTLTNSDEDKQSVATTNESTHDDSTTDGHNTSTNTEDNSTMDSAPSSTPTSPDVQETRQWGTQQKRKNS